MHSMHTRDLHSSQSAPTTHAAPAHLRANHTQLFIVTRSGGGTPDYNRDPRGACKPDWHATCKVYE